MFNDLEFSMNREEKNSANPKQRRAQKPPITIVDRESFSFLYEIETHD
jgi:hypothetical protein